MADIDDFPEEVLRLRYLELTERYGVLYAPPLTMNKKQDVVAALTTALRRTGDSLIKILNPNPVSQNVLTKGTSTCHQGIGRTRFLLYGDGMLVSTWVDLCYELDKRRDLAYEQLRRDRDKKYIGLVDV